MMMPISTPGTPSVESMTSSTASSRVRSGSVTPIDWLVSIMNRIFTGKSSSSGSVVQKLPLTTACVGALGVRGGMGSSSPS